MDDENFNDITTINPDWDLIDEISIPLLEQGIGSFDILQRTLPTIVLSKFEKQNEEWTEARIAKMFRIAQLQIRYVLQSQQTLVKELEHERDKVAKAAKINQTFRKSIMQSQRSSRELFKCDECSKLFLHSSFLSDHIQRKHRSHASTTALNLDVSSSPPVKILTTPAGATTATAGSWK
uniref:C2H2-type domain-containing protein n=2 Tax=Panagrellus redivivus TaxID=6233 RepID=A0A7E4UUK9_PANRE